jgi:hypothetical protein
MTDDRKITARSKEKEQHQQAKLKKRTNKNSFSVEETNLFF